MAVTDLTSRIETALKQATDFESFAQGLLRDCLRWPIERNVGTPEELGYFWSADELSASVKRRGRYPRRYPRLP